MSQEFLLLTVSVVAFAFGFFIATARARKRCAASERTAEIPLGCTSPKGSFVMTVREIHRSRPVPMIYTTVYGEVEEGLVTVGDLVYLRTVRQRPVVIVSALVGSSLVEKVSASQDVGLLLRGVNSSELQAGDQIVFPAQQTSAPIH